MWLFSFITFPSVAFSFAHASCDSGAWDVWPRPVCMKCKDDVQYVRFDHSRMSFPMESMRDLLLDTFDDLAGSGEGSTLSIRFEIKNEHAKLEFGVNEEYEMDIEDHGQITIRSETNFGALHAMETLSQLIKFDLDKEIHYMPKSCNINDSPRFQHRGLLIDTGRHFLPVPFMERIIDSLRMHKLNVLHWHLTEIQSFPYKSKIHPELAQAGAFSKRERYTLSQLKAVVEYAKARGVRVVVELDQPGHTAAMYDSHPELFACGRSHNIDAPALDPTNDEVYGFMMGLMDELFTIFDDGFIHIGTDETPFDCYQNLSLKPADAFKSYVNKIHNKLQSRNKTVIMWDEALNASPPTRNSVIQIWHGAFGDVNALKHALDAGYMVISSVDGGDHGWYLDSLTQTWEQMYAAEIVPEWADEAQGKVIGGEGCMWGETVDPSNFESTVWPRMSAIAERLWSLKEVNDVDSARSRLQAWRCTLLSRGIGTAPVGVDGRASPDGPGGCTQLPVAPSVIENEIIYQ